MWNFKKYAAISIAKVGYRVAFGEAPQIKGLYATSLMRQFFSITIIMLPFACNTSTQTSSNESTESVATVATVDSLTTNSEEPQQVEPELEFNPEVAANFINSYIENVDKRSERIEIRKWTQASELVTDNFKSQLDSLITDSFEREPEYGLGFDPILHAQDYPDGGFHLLNFDESTGLATVNGIEGPSFHIPVILVIIDGRTFVDGCGAVNIPKELLVVQ